MFQKSLYNLGHARKVPLSTVWRKWPRRMHALPVRGRTPSLPQRHPQVPQHPFPRSVDWSSSADTRATSFPRSYRAGFLLVGFCQRPSLRATPTCKCHRAPNSNYRRSCRTDARDAASRVGRNWIQVGRLPHHKRKSYRTITVRGKTWCVCLPAYISKYCVRPLYKLIYAFQIVKRLLKHPVYTSIRRLHTTMHKTEHAVRLCSNAQIPMYSSTICSRSKNRHCVACLISTCAALWAHHPNCLCWKLLHVIPTFSTPVRHRINNANCGMKKRSGDSPLVRRWEGRQPCS
jgi:hypothetical protein